MYQQGQTTGSATHQQLGIGQKQHSQEGTGDMHKGSTIKCERSILKTGKCNKYVKTVGDETEILRQAVVFVQKNAGIIP
jgi:hypothetical protein